MTNTRELEAKVKVKRAYFYAKYGGIFAAACKLLKTEAEARTIGGWRVDPKDEYMDGFPLMRIALVSERTAWDEFLKGETSRDSCPSHYAILEICRSTSSDPVEIWRKANFIFSMYSQNALTNELRIDFTTMIREGRFRDIAEILHSDYYDLSSIAPENKALLDLLQNVILMIIDAWFVRNKFATSQYDVWTSTAVLDKFREDLAAEEKCDADVIKNMHTHIAHELERRMANLKAEDKSDTDAVKEMHTHIAQEPRRRSDFMKEEASSKSVEYTCCGARVYDFMKQPVGYTWCGQKIYY